MPGLVQPFRLVHAGLVLGTSVGLVSGGLHSGRLGGCRLGPGNLGRNRVVARLGAVPMYAYNYGTDITYQNGTVYYGAQPAVTAAQYYQEASAVADTGANGNGAQDSDWLPLGVFGLMPEGQKTPQMVFQIAVNKEGTVRGNYYDQATNTNLPVTGAVDKKNQRVAWRTGKNKDMIVETGLYNLTLNESTVLVHEGPTKTQEEVLVRLKQPSVNQSPGS